MDIRNLLSTKGYIPASVLQNGVLNHTYNFMLYLRSHKYDLKCRYSKMKFPAEISKVSFLAIMAQTRTLKTSIPSEYSAYDLDCSFKSIVREMNSWAYE